MHIGGDTVALVNGAGSGLGLAFCRALLQRGAKLVAVDRCPAQELAERLGGGAKRVLCADTATVEGVTRVLEAVRQAGPVDLLVNSAPGGVGGGFLQQSPAGQRDFLARHCETTVTLCRAALPFMRERGHGAIVNPVPAPGPEDQPAGALQAATGAFLLHFSRQLQAEVADLGVRVQALCVTGSEAELAGAVEASLQALADGPALLVPDSAQRERLRAGFEELARALAD